MLSRLTTLPWITCGDVHLNISSPGRAKHAWSSFFAPWIAEATIQFYSYTRFGASRFLTMLRRADVASLCAPPTLWRMLAQADLGAKPAALREVVGPGSPVKRGSMGRPLPGVAVEILDPVSGQPASEGEICLRLDPRPVHLMSGYLGGDGGSACSRLLWYRPPTQPGWPCPRLISAWRPGGPPIGPPPTRFSPMQTETLRPINASGALNSWNHLRPSPARSGVSSVDSRKHLRTKRFDV
jgi:hypothetical protein